MPETKKQRALAFACIFAVAYGAVAAGSHLYISWYLLPTMTASADDLARLEPRILADLKLLREKPIFTELAREKNAERFISGFIACYGDCGVNHSDALETPEHEKLVAMMRVHDHALRSDDEWSAFLDDEALEELDLAWVDQLIAYDHIDFATHPSYISALARVETSHGIERLAISKALPFPAMNELRFATLARAAQLSLEDRGEEARRIYRHISYLLSTTDSLMGSLVSVSMLENEKQLSERLDFSWNLIDDARIRAMRRTSMAWGGIVNVQAGRGEFGLYQDYFSRSTNACAVSNEAVGRDVMLEDYLKPTAFLEMDFSDQLMRTRALQKKILEICEHENLDVFLKPMPPSNLMAGRLKMNPARVPFLRRVLGLTLLSVASPNYFSEYDQIPREPSSK